MIIIKTDEEIEIMKEAGRIAAIIRDKLAELVKPGTSTIFLDKKAEKLMESFGVRPSFKGHHGYPASITVSINEEVVHGIPKKRKIKNGDIVSIDLAVIYKDYHADNAITVAAGKIPEEWTRLMKVTEESLYIGIEQAKPGNYLKDISGAIEEYVLRHGFTIVKELAGHGIGRSMWEEPHVTNYVKENDPDIILKPGMTLAIEPMVNLGGPDVYLLSDNWTVITRDRQPSAHYEHTIAITENGPVILTRY